MVLNLRKWTLADLDDLVRSANNPRIAQNLTNQFPHPYLREHGQAFIAMTLEADPTRIFAIEVDGEACGAIGLHPQTDVFARNAEMGYWLAEPYWGRGIMTQAIVQMATYGFATFDLDRIYARPFGPNLGSQRALEKAGFTLEARFANTVFKHGQHLDELVYGLRRAV